VQTARKAWHLRVSSSSTFWLDQESTGEGILLCHPDNNASDVFLQVWFASILTSLRMVVLLHDIPGRGKNAWTSDSEVSSKFRWRCRLPAGYESSRVSSYHT
jgi:hypothetical protein